MKDLSVFGTAGVDGMADDGSGGETVTKEEKKKVLEVWESGGKDHTVQK